MDDTNRRIARARLLRRQGKTYAEICAVVGDVDSQRLSRWLRGIPRPPETFRSRPYDALRRECRRLRAQGLTYAEIAARTGASKGSISLWVHDVPLPPGAAEERAIARTAAMRRGSATMKRLAEERQQAARAEGMALAGMLSERDLFVAGLALYWSEGSKDKPWRREGRVRLINSDAGVLEMFLAWLDLMGVPEESRTYCLHIHQSADAHANERWWAERLGLSLTSFAPATLKRHNPATARHNCGEDYHGCLTVRVAKSRRLYDLIDGGWAALAAQVRHTERDRSAVGKSVIPSDFDSEVSGSSPDSGA